MYKQYVTLTLAGLLLQSSGVLGHQERPKPLILRRDDGTVFNPNPYPYCDPKKDEFCITNGKYLLPPLEIQAPDDKGDTAYKKHLPTHEFTLDKWTNGMMPEMCYELGVKHDGWNVEDFEVYNATFSDCEKSPFVICYNTKAQKTPKEIAVEISRLPAGMRQATSTFLVYSDLESDNPSYKGFIGAACPEGVIAGLSEAYFITSLIHEIGHSIDCTLASPDASPGGSGSEFSSTATWQDAVDKDGVAVSPYGTGSYVENFGEAGRLVLMDNIYPGGLKAWSDNHPNITQLKNQLDAIKKSAAGDFYNKGGECDLKLKFPFPTRLVDVAKIIEKEGKGKDKEKEDPTTTTLSGGDEEEEASIRTTALVEPRPGPTTPASEAGMNPDAKKSGARRLRPLFFFL